MKTIKVRFNLGKGKNYMKWKIESKSGVEYHSPDDVTLVMKNCLLKNSRKIAEKIFNGENKTVCAWIVCDSISIINKNEDISVPSFLKLLSYNPRKKPFWTNNKNEDLDNKTAETICAFNSILLSSNIK